MFALIVSMIPFNLPSTSSNVHESLSEFWLISSADVATPPALAALPSAEYHEKKNGEHGVWNVKGDIALPCATQNKLDLDDAKALVANGVISVTEGANMPTTLEATKYLQENGVLFVGGKTCSLNFLNFLK